MEKLTQSSKIKVKFESTTGSEALYGWIIDYTLDYLVIDIERGGILMTVYYDTIEDKFISIPALDKFKLK